MRDFLSPKFAFGSLRDEWIIMRILVKNIFFANLADSGNSKTFSFFLSDDSMGDMMPDFFGDINIR